MADSLITLTLQSKEIIDIATIASLLEQCPSVLIDDIRRIQDIHWDDANVLGYLAGDIAQQFGRSEVTELKVWVIPRRDDDVDRDKAVSYGVLLGGVDLIRSLNSQPRFRYHLLPKELPRDVKKFLLLIYPKLVAHFQSSPSSSSSSSENDAATAYEFNDTYGYFLDLHEITYGCNNILERSYLGAVQPSGVIADAILAQKPWIETMITPRKWQYFCQGMYFTAEVYQHIFRCAGLTVGGAKTVLQAVYAATVEKMSLQLKNHIWQDICQSPIYLSPPQRCCVGFS